jgi:hypothetical protein
VATPARPVGPVAPWCPAFAGKGFGDGESRFRLAVRYRLGRQDHPVAAPNPFRFEQLVDRRRPGGPVRQNRARLAEKRPDASAIPVQRRQLVEFVRPDRPIVAPDRNLVSQRVEPTGQH